MGLEILNRQLGRREMLLLTGRLGKAIAISSLLPVSPVFALEGNNASCALPERVEVPLQAVEQVIGMRMGTIHDFYEMQIPCGRLIPKEWILDLDNDGMEVEEGINIGLKNNAPPVPIVLYPGVLEHIPREWSNKPLRTLFQLSKLLPGYFTPAHLPKSALLVLSNTDSVSIGVPPYNQPVVAFRESTMSGNLMEAFRRIVHEGAHLGDPMEVTQSNPVSTNPFLCDPRMDGAGNNEIVIVTSSLHEAIYEILGGSYSNPPEKIREWIEYQRDKAKENNMQSGYNPRDRWAYALSRQYPVELVGVSCEFLMQGENYYQNVSKIVIRAGIISKSQINKLKELMLTKGPLTGRSLQEFKCLQY